MKISEYIFVKIDIVEHSILLAQGQSKEVWEILDAFHTYVKDVVASQGGKVPSWQGDGGLCWFETGAKRERVDKGVQAALKILRGVSPFDLQSEPFKGAKTRIKIRIAVHLGTARPQANPGNVHSPDINLVAHLEREALPNSIVITQTALQNCEESTQKLFKPLTRVKSVEFFGQPLSICDIYGPRLIQTWENVLIGAGMLIRQIRDQRFNPHVVVGCGRSAGIVGAILAGNFDQPNFVVLSRRRKDNKDRKIEVNPIAILNPKKSVLPRSAAVLLAFYEIDSSETLRAYLAYLQNDAGFKPRTVFVATLYISSHARATLEKDKTRHAWAYEGEPDWNDTPWKLHRHWNKL